MEKLVRSSTFKTLSLIIPVFNERSNLGVLKNELLELTRSLHEIHVSLEVVMVDNHSSDGTWDILRSWGEDNDISFRATLIRHPENLGMQQSLITGLRHARGDALAVLQSDLQDPPKLLLQMVKAWNGGELKFIASQISKREGNVSSRFASWWFYRALSLSSSHRVLHDASDFYLFDKSLTAGVLAASGSTPFLRSNLQSLVRPDLVIRYVREDRVNGRSKFNFGQKVSFAFDAILPNISGLIRRAILLGTVTGVLAILAATYLSIAYLLGYRSPVEGWLSTIVVLLVILATTVIMGSLSLELLSRIYKDLPREDKSLKSEVIELDQTINPLNKA
jgi:dolichol-phosphate mannosyltransferase